VSIIQGTAVADTLIGGSDDDEIRGGAGNDVISGLGGNDQLYGEAGDDTIDGGDGFDAIQGGDGSDTLRGGIGNDQIIAAGGDGAQVDVGTVNYLYGEAGDDYLVGSAGRDILDGGDGNDILQGGRGDTLLGGDGDDRLSLDGYGDAGQTGRIEGGAGNDSLTGYNDADVMYGGAGNDSFWGGSGGDTLYGGDGNDSFFADGRSGSGMPGDAGSTNYLYGEAGDDNFYGGAGVDILDGGAGADVLQGWTGDTLLGGDGDDTLTLTSTFMGAAIDALGTLDGGAGNDKITLHEGNYKVTGGAGADLITNIAGVWAKGYATITDFKVSEGDRLSFGESYPDYDRKVFRGSLENPNFSLRPGQAYSSKDYGPGFTQVWTWADGGDTYLLYDVDGSGKLSDADIVMRFTGLSTLDVSAFVASTFLMKIDGTDGADSYAGTAGADVYRAVNGDDLLHGGAGNDALYAGNGSDQLWGDDGDDFLQGGLGDDEIDGGAGVNRASYFGYAADYSWTKQGDGSWKVVGSDGTDTLRNIDFLIFADRSVSLMPTLPAEVATAFASILRQQASPSYSSGAYSMIADLIDAGASTSNVMETVIRLAGATTSVASLAYEFFTGKIPGQAGIDYLVSPTGWNINNLNSAYYQSFNLENRYINFAVNLGKVGEGKDAFLAKYGSLSFVDATREAYKTIFGAAPTDAKIHAMIDSRVDYFAAYGGDGANGIGTKAAMVGWLLAEAQKADLGVMVRSNDAWLTDLADGSAPFAIDILDPAKGYYKADFIFGG
jgi:Ca2+-binding RTX toxin-like protein